MATGISTTINGITYYGTVAYGTLDYGTVTYGTLDRQGRDCYRVYAARLRYRTDPSAHAGQVVGTFRTTNVRARLDEPRRFELSTGVVTSDPTVAGEDVLRTATVRELVGQQKGE